MPAARIFRFARTSSWVMVGSGTRTARAPTRRGRRSRARSVLDHRPYLDRPAVAGRGDLRGELDRLVDVLALDEVEAAQVLLRLRERAVGGKGLAVVDADGRRARKLAQIGAAARLRPLAERHVLVHLLFPLLLAELLPAIAGAVDQERVLHVSSFGRLRGYDERDRPRSTPVDTMR